MSAKESYPTQALVLAYLTEQGYKIKKSALSNHVRAGLLKKKKGVFNQRDIDSYAMVQLQEKESGETSSDKKGRKLQEQKLRREIRLKDEAILKAVHEREIMEGKYILRSKVEVDLVGRGLVLKEGLTHTIHTYVAEWCAVVDGDQAHISDLESAMVARMEQLLHDYAALASLEIVFREAVANV